MTFHMKPTYIHEIQLKKNEEVLIRGWVYSKRSSGKIKFLVIRDGTGTIQGVLAKGECPDVIFDVFDDLTQESSIEVTGKVNEHRSQFELHIRDIRLLQKCNDYPISPKEHGTDFLLDRRHLWLRSSRQHAILRIRSELIRACHDFFLTRGFTHLDAPIFTPSACEGTTTLFEVKYFDEKAYLTQSGQLYMEAGCMAFGKVYCFGPTFRAEKSKTRRHLTEFWMIEPEVAFMTLEEDMVLTEQFIEYLVQHVLSTRSKELDILERDTKILKNTKTPFPRLSYDASVTQLQQAGHTFSWGGDFGAEDETTLANKFETPFFVHRFPAAIKAFYMKQDAEDPRLSLSMDLLAPEGYGEIIGGGQREENIDVLLVKMAEHGLNPKDFEWYLDLRRYGSVPHAGFGMGIERMLAWICGISHVRETIPFPRMLYRMRP